MIKHPLELESIIVKEGALKGYRMTINLHCVPEQWVKEYEEKLKKVLKPTK